MEEEIRTPVYTFSLAFQDRARTRLIDEKFYKDIKEVEGNLVKQWLRTLPEFFSENESVLVEKNGRAKSVGDKTFKYISFKGVLYQISSGGGCLSKDKTGIIWLRRYCPTDRDKIIKEARYQLEFLVGGELSLTERVRIKKIAEEVVAKTINLSCGGNFNIPENLWIYNSYAHTLLECWGFNVPLVGPQKEIFPRFRASERDGD